MMENPGRNAIPRVFSQSKNPSPRPARWAIRKSPRHTPKVSCSQI